MADKGKIILFQGKNIRRTWQDTDWWFSIIDVMEILTGSSNPRRYWSDLKIKLKEEGFELYGKIVQLKLSSLDGKKYTTDCMDTESMLRLIQSIPSKKAEPFKRWLAKVGYERIQEMENPELAQNRAREYYKIKGYPEHWIEKRLRGIAIRQELTKEWEKRDVKKGKEYAILTNEISTATFGVPIQEHKDIKGLNPKFKNQNLRDHMTDLELIFSMLGEKMTAEVARKDDAQGFDQNKDAAKKGGGVAGRARIDAEKTIGTSVMSEKNHVGLQKKKQIENKA